MRCSLTWGLGPGDLPVVTFSFAVGLRMIRGDLLTSNRIWPTAFQNSLKNCISISVRMLFNILHLNIQFLSITEGIYRTVVFHISTAHVSLLYLSVMTMMNSFSLYSFGSVFETVGSWKQLCFLLFLGYQSLDFTQERQEWTITAMEPSMRSLWNLVSKASSSLFRQDEL